MEIRYLRQEENERTRPLYEEVFVEDEQAFVDAYYRIKAKDNRILVAEDAGQIAAMLHCNPYTFRFRGQAVPADYIVAVATRRAYRHQGLMRSLLTKALRDMRAEKHPFTFLMPADEAIYTPFDFRLMGNDDGPSAGEAYDGEAGQELSAAQLAAEYELFVEKDADYRRRHIDWPEWEETPMMIRLVDVSAFVKQIGARKEQSLVLAIEDSILPENNGTFLWSFAEDGSTLCTLDSYEGQTYEEQAQKEVQSACELRISIADLGSFLCGMIGPEDLPTESFCGKPEEVREKLECIRVLEGIYINETV